MANTAPLVGRPKSSGPAAGAAGGVEHGARRDGRLAHCGGAADPGTGAGRGMVVGAPPAQPPAGGNQGSRCAGGRMAGDLALASGGTAWIAARTSAAAGA